MDIKCPACGALVMTFTGEALPGTLVRVSEFVYPDGSHPEPGHPARFICLCGETVYPVMEVRRARPQ